MKSLIALLIISQGYLLGARAQERFYPWDDRAKIEAAQDVFEQGQARADLSYDVACDLKKISHKAFCLEGYAFARYRQSVDTKFYAAPQACIAGVALGMLLASKSEDELPAQYLGERFASCIVDGWAFWRGRSREKIAQEGLNCRREFDAKFVKYCEFGIGRASFFRKKSLLPARGYFLAGRTLARMFVADGGISSPPRKIECAIRDVLKERLSPGLRECLDHGHLLDCLNLASCP